MNVENIKEGQVFKNYKELCLALNIKPKTSNSKKAQIKEWERYFYWENIGHKIIIKDIYDIPLPPNNNILQYQSIIERLIMNLIVDSTNDLDNTLYIPKSKLLQILNMINKEYSSMKYRKLQMSKQYDIPSETVIDFYTTSDRMMKGNIERALNSLKNRSLATWSDVFTICKMHIVDERNNENESEVEVIKTINEYGDELKNYKTRKREIIREHREATKEETEIILAYQRMVLEEMDIESISDAFKSGKSNMFYEEVAKRLQKDYNIETYYSSYSLVFNRLGVVKAYNNIDHFLLDDRIRVALEDELNDGIVDRILYNGKNRHETAKKENKINNIITIRKEEKYIEDIATLCKMLIENNS